MISIDEARRAAVEVSFDGVDITGSMAPYLLSLTYTDNEEDAADDLQIKLQDRDGIWLENWLADVINAAAEETTTSGGGDANPDALNAGVAVTLDKTPLYVSSTATSPAAHKTGTFWLYDGELVSGRYRITNAESRVGKKPVGQNVTGWVNAADIGASASDTEDGSGAGTATSLQIGAIIARENWNGDSKQEVLDCGIFELDGLKPNGPPATITIKATSLPYDCKIRQTKRSKAWEAYKLSGIVQEMAQTNGLTVMYLSGSDPYYDRVEQFKESDTSFLSRLCHDAGISLKVTTKMIVLFDQAEYEAKDPVRTITQGDGSYTKYDLNAGTADKKYQSCRVSYVSPTNGKCIEGIAYISGYNAKSKTNQQLEVAAKVSNAAEARRLAAKRLRLHNKYQQMVAFTLPGDTSLVAGVTILLCKWGCFDGKYIIKTAVHTVSGSGYTTKITARRVLEGY